MQPHRAMFLLLIVVGLAATSGASCPRMVGQATGRPVLPAQPTLEEVIEVVNQNNAQIRSFSTTDASISTPEMPISLRNTSIAFERPRRLRVRGGTLVTGPELDMGSNDDLFWVWIRRDPQQSLYFCRHDQYANSPIRQMLPVDPDWLIEAMGVAEFDPSLEHRGPFLQRNGCLEIRTIRQTAEGPVMKITVVDAVKGQILGQHLLDPRGRLVASAIVLEHRSDPVSGLTMPRKLDIRLPASQLAMQIDLGKVRINRLAGDPQQLWAMPQYDDYPLVDLGRPDVRLQSSVVEGMPTYDRSMQRPALEGPMLRGPAQREPAMDGLPPAAGSGRTTRRSGAGAALR